ncbi:MAG: hypothetical protein NTV04_21525 [Deltaproteobacteria bacterium]|nr:hypothetical protein [Deltaproteobacteria bacterium]
MIDYQKVMVKEKNVTMVALQVEMVGNKLSSQMIQDKIGENLKK